MSARINIKGRRFGRLTVVRHVGWKLGGSIWQCRCTCGAVTNTRASHLLSGRSKSCGCFSAEKVGDLHRTHGMTRTPEWKTWANIRQRCTNPRHISFRYYGAKGVKVCQRWMKFENFFSDMGKRPAGHSIDRFPDNNGNYEPSNCRWATPKQQANNLRSRS